MAIAILTENLAVHQSMADEPNGEDGLTAGEVKAKFDQAALAIQKYLNETVVPAVNAAGEGVRTVNGQTPGPDGNVVIEQGVAQSYVDAAVQEVLESRLVAPLVAEDARQREVVGALERAARVPTPAPRGRLSLSR